MIDLHCHILPGIDDGPETAEGAFELARAAVAVGTTRVVATPHVSSGFSYTTGLRIAEATLLLNRVLQAEGIQLRVSPGAEVSLDRAGELHDGELRRLRLGAGPWMLVECPFTGPAAGFEAALHALAARGNRILLAHPERIQGFQDDRALISRLVAQGMLCQLTAGALVGRFGGVVERFAHRLLQEGLAHVVASDAHDAVKRSPSVRAELEQAGVSEEGVRFLTLEAPEAMLAGKPVPMPPTLLAKRRSGRRLRRSG